MRNLFKKLALVAAVFGSTLFASGCLGLGGLGNWKIWTAILNAELFH